MNTKCMAQLYVYIVFSEASSTVFHVLLSGKCAKDCNHMQVQKANYTEFLKVWFSIL